MTPVSAWSPKRRRIISLLIALHLCAVVAAPMSGPPPASDLSRRIASIFDPYLKAAFLSHGYRFFAPNPGPSHLVRYEVLFSDGRVENHQFPSTSGQWPRLYYHRHFMVAEQVNQLAEVPTSEEFEAQMKEREDLANEIRDAGNGLLARQIRDDMLAERQAFERQTQLKDGLLGGMAQYFLRFHGGESIRIFSVRHPIPSPIEVESGFQLDTPDSYLLQQVYASPDLREWPNPNETLEEMP